MWAVILGSSSVRGGRYGRGGKESKLRVSPYCRLLLKASELRPDRGFWKTALNTPR